MNICNDPSDDVYGSKKNPHFLIFCHFCLVSIEKDMLYPNAIFQNLF
jgi:hypothetical protein